VCVCWQWLVFGHGVVVFAASGLHLLLRVDVTLQTASHEVVSYARPPVDRHQLDFDQRELLPAPRLPDRLQFLLARQSRHAPIHPMHIILCRLV